MGKVACIILSFVCCASIAQAGQPNPKVFSILGAMDLSPPDIKQRLHLIPQIATANDQPTRADVVFKSKLLPGTIVVKTAERKLYLIEPNQRALSWSVAVGREGFAWKGSNSITRMAQWPDWRPPPEMIQREAANGHLIPDFVKGGPGNPLGSRALYLGESAYRIHGTDKPWTIGQASSSGCIRMMNADVEELYSLSKVGTRVIVE